MADAPGLVSGLCAASTEPSRVRCPIARLDGTWGAPPCPQGGRLHTPPICGRRPTSTPTSCVMRAAIAIGWGGVKSGGERMAVGPGGAGGAAPGGGADADPGRRGAAVRPDRRADRLRLTPPEWSVYGTLRRPLTASSRRRWYFSILTAARPNTDDAPLTSTRIGLSPGSHRSPELQCR